MVFQRTCLRVMNGVHHQLHVAHICTQIARCAALSQLTVVFDIDGAVGVFVYAYTCVSCRNYIGHNCSIKHAY